MAFSYCNSLLEVRLIRLLHIDAVVLVVEDPLLAYAFTAIFGVVELWGTKKIVRKSPKPPSIRCVFGHHWLRACVCEQCGREFHEWESGTCSRCGKTCAHDWEIAEVVSHGSEAGGEIEPNRVRYTCSICGKSEWE